MSAAPVLTSIQRRPMREKRRLFHAPRATYRLQLHKDFGFEQAKEILPYLKSLGISGCYLSPITKARPGSMHGYDAVDYHEINPELGGIESFAEFAKAAFALGIKVIVDVVPNHMCVADSSNTYWMDVLENGPSSPYADFFDINWHPEKKELHNKVLLPILGDQYGKVLENGDIRIAYEQGTFWATYFQTRFPLGPQSWTDFLEPVLLKYTAQAKPEDHSRTELESVLNALRHLPSPAETASAAIKERAREKEVIKRRLSALLENNTALNHLLEEEIVQINGIKGQPRSFDRLEALLNKQAYRLCDWIVASDEINYRRFFDVNELAALRMEDPKVFEDANKTIFDAISKGLIHGLRIDHVDGLLDPEGFLKLLQEKAAVTHPLFIVVEKILSKNEQLDANWPVCGTTGYEFVDWCNRLFVDPVNLTALKQAYRKFAQIETSFHDIVVASKKLVMLTSMAGELRTLSSQLDRISEQHRWSRDFTREGLRSALREVIACFPVYRSYTQSKDQLLPADRAATFAAVREAKKRNPSTSESIFDFIHSVLTLEYPEGLAEEQKQERLRFVKKFQQFTGPVMAKGLEDTSFYRYGPLLSLNEVGSRPDEGGLPRRNFHRLMRERQTKWPLSLSASSTHDTKRSEDTRARINVLSEIPGRWNREIRSWHKLNTSQKTRDNDSSFIPDKNEEYFIYQTLVGTWPLTPKERDGYAGRIQDYMLKSLREAKLNSSWIRPNTAYEKGTLDFIERILDPARSEAFINSFQQFNDAILKPGLFNALSQMLLKICCPGVPDFYQGTDLWRFQLVDPDNRGPVDYREREQMLAALRKHDVENPDTAFIDNLLAHLEDGRIKLFMLHRLLALRNRYPLLFQEGAYEPLLPAGDFRRNVVTFARVREEEAAVVVAGRFFTDMTIDQNKIDWKKTWIDMPRWMTGGRWKNVFTNQIFILEEDSRLELQEAMAGLPCAVFEKLPPP